MVRLNSGTGRCALGLFMGLAPQMLSAQALGLSASDPVGIGRGGTGVAFGASLEAASLNPALLASLREQGGVFVGIGQELQSAQHTIAPNGIVRFSSDRNRELASFGSAWRLRETLVLGLKLDQPFMRHSEFPFEDTLRFQGRAIDLTTRRLEAQAAWSPDPHWSFGAGLGIAQVRYASEDCVRTQVPNPPDLPDLMEVPLRQEGHGNAITYSLGFRWAIDPRWTIGGAFQSAIRTSPAWTANVVGQGPFYYGYNGSDTPSDGTTARGLAILGRSTAMAGSGRVSLPARAAVGVRQRVNQLFTWEADLRYVGGQGLEMPTQPGLMTPGGGVYPLAPIASYRNGLGLSAMAEFTLDKAWTARIGGELQSAIVSDVSGSPLIGGSAAAAFSGGLGYKTWGGEINLGYQFRQSYSEDSTKLDGAWSVAQGYHPTGNVVRVEGKGHLWSIGYKRMF